jgi:hypothetical protein
MLDEVTTPEQDYLQRTWPTRSTVHDETLAQGSPLNHRAFITAGLLATVALLAPAATAQASTPSQPQATATTTVDADAYYATPDELRKLGFDSAAVAKQQKLVAKMPAAEKRKQDARRASQASISRTASTSRLFTTNSVGIRPCDEQATRDYKTYEKDGTGNHPTCFNGAGTITMGYDLRASSLQANSETGRVLYSYKCAECQTYWSTWRGPNDTKQYLFETIVGPAHIYQVQLK